MKVSVLATLFFLGGQILSLLEDINIETLIIRAILKIIFVQIRILWVIDENHYKTKENHNYNIILVSSF